MTLRARVVLLLVGLLALGSLVSGGAVFGALQDWAGERSEDVLAAAAADLGAELAARPPQERRLGPGPRGSEGPGALWAGMAERGDAPSSVRLLDADGRVVDTLAIGDPPLLEEAPAGEGDFRRAPAVPGGAPVWLLHTSRLPDGWTLEVGMRVDADDALVGRAGRVVLTCSLLSLALVAALAAPLVRRTLRPLESVAATAEVIGAGDLSRRVATGEPATAEVGRLEGALNAMLDRLETAFADRRAAEERLRAFVADASHELRTPIATVRGYAELFRRGAADRPGDLATAMRRIEEESTRMGSLVEEMLLLARLDRERPPRERPVDLVAAAGDAVADARAADPARDYGLVPAAGSVGTVGDPDRIRQTLANLLANVAHHTPEGTRAEVRVRATGTEAVVEVRDDGPGPPPGDPERLFDRFHRGSGPRAGGGGGAGLGLAVVAAIVHAHGGTVAAGTAPGGGAVFTVRLPRASDTVGP